MIDKVAYLYLKDQKILSTRSKGKDTYYPVSYTHLTLPTT